MIRQLGFSASRVSRFAGVALVLGAFVAGCGNSPEGVCKKVAALQEKSGKEGGKKENPEECVKKVGEIKEKDPAKFECLAKCADEADMDKATSCIIKCPDAAASAKPAK
jgi:hypothetical protein